MTDNTAIAANSSTTQTEKFQAACAYIRGSIALAIVSKDITLTDDEISTAAHSAADRLTVAEIEALVQRQLHAEARASVLGYDAMSWAYAKKLCALLPTLTQATHLSVIAMEHHLCLADIVLAPWPMLEVSAIARFIDSDIGPVPHSFADGIITSTYYRGIRLHRPESEGPALTAITRSGVVIDEEYWRLGMRHRANGPATIKTDREDATISEEWMLFGRLTRQGAPSYIRRTADGRVNFEMWYYNGILHRDDGPAYIECSRYDDSVWEIYAVNGVEGPLLQNGVRVGE
ncbi:MAG: hypothetical protein ABL901_20365 [Hyphomicrobiaceae bacterium]